MLISFPKIEKKILKFWQENKIFEKSIEQRKKASNFVFYEGPPTANAAPGIHHVLARVFKDIICRYKTMRGFKVERKAGWDTHGLPVELEIEKKLGLKNKKDIERYGIAPFNKLCKESVWQYKKDWERLTERIGFWLDMENPYITYTPEYIESVWWIIKQTWHKGLLYKDYKVVPYCPRCGTSLSSHEVAQGYEKIKEPAIYVKYEVRSPKYENTYLLVWTTTPWTLPGNVAIAVNPDFTYVKVKVDDEYLILAKERMEVSGIKGEIVEEFKGKVLLGLEYEPLYPQLIEVRPLSVYKVIAADFVSLEEGTGLVHIAPAFGEEDLAAFRQQFPISNFQFPKPVDGEGKFTLEVKKWAGMFVKEADPLIINDLKNRNLLFKEEIYEHDYPFCWRCDSPLLYYAKESWFINMQKVKKDLISNNQKINWIPYHLKEGRFGEWLKEIKDWALSRERYWGTPLPVWQCQTGKNQKSCDNIVVIGSREDLLRQKFSNNRYLILRHGHSVMNEKGIIISTLPEKISCPLTERGREEIKKVAQKLKHEKIDVIISSDLLRAKETAEIIGKELGITLIFDQRLRDIQAGVYEGKTLSEFQSFWETFEERFIKKPEGGESYNDVKIRIYEFLKEIDKKYNGKTILLIGHQRVFAMLEGAVNGLSIKEFLEKIEPNKIKTGELREIKFKNFPYNEEGELDFHRPYIDEVEFYCPKCGEKMKRVPEVIDCWFDSGSMPFGQYHYPFENKNLIDKKEQFPADFISEAIDQTRGWFYTLLAISTLLGFKTPYKNVISLGHVLDEKGEKMSKSKGNVVDPWYIVEKYGADAVRWYFYTINQPGDAKLFSEKEIGESLRRFIITLWNCYSFFETYVPKKETQISKFKFQNKFKIPNPKHVLDKWVISKLNGLIFEVTNYLDKYDITNGARLIENFVIDDFSQWYIRRSRKRFRAESENFEAASAILNYTLLTLSKLTAPFIPFISEEIYQNLQTSRCLMSNITQSVHLEDWPKVEKGLINKELEEKMRKVREIVALALAERAKARIKVRQPLNELRITNYELKNKPELLELIKEEVNVKKITFGKTLKLNTEITSELREEGIIREVIRNIQEMRKLAGLKPENKILVYYTGVYSLSYILKKNSNLILKETLANDLNFFPKRETVVDIEKEINIDGEKLWLGIKKI